MVGAWWVGSPTNACLSAELRSAWTLKTRSARGQMRSPAMAGMDGDVCVSVEALALGSAKLTVSVENIDGSTQPVPLAEIVPSATVSGASTLWTGAPWCCCN